MPNGGPDNCGECQFNPASLARLPGAAAAHQTSASCEIRGIDPIERPYYTYCANFHTGSLSPEGPVFSGFHETDRLPWHGLEPVRMEHLTEGFRLAVLDGATHRSFEDAAAYVAWWRTVHPGETAEFAWALHERAFSPEHRAAGRDRPGLARRVWARIVRSVRDRQ